MLRFRTTVSSIFGIEPLVVIARRVIDQHDAGLPERNVIAVMGLDTVRVKAGQPWIRRHRVRPPVERHFIVALRGAQRDRPACRFGRIGLGHDVGRVVDPVDAHVGTGLPVVPRDDLSRQVDRVEALEEPDAGRRHVDEHNFVDARLQQPFDHPVGIVTPRIAASPLVIGRHATVAGAAAVGQFAAPVNARKEQGTRIHMMRRVLGNPARIFDDEVDAEFRLARLENLLQLAVTQPRQIVGRIRPTETAVFERILAPLLRRIAEAQQHRPGLRIPDDALINGTMRVVTEYLHRRIPRRLLAVLVEPAVHEIHDADFRHGFRRAAREQRRGQNRR